MPWRSGEPRRTIRGGAQAREDWGSRTWEPQVCGQSDPGQKGLSVTGNPHGFKGQRGWDYLSLASWGQGGRQATVDRKSTWALTSVRWESTGGTEQKGGHAHRAALGQSMGVGQTHSIQQGGWATTQRHDVSNRGVGKGAACICLKVVPTGVPLGWCREGTSTGAWNWRNGTAFYQDGETRGGPGLGKNM